MNFSKLWQTIFVGVCAGSLLCSHARGQGNGLGTTGATAGSGTGNGSAGVMTGGGPDVTTPPQETGTENATRMTVVRSTTEVKKTAKVHKRSKKTEKKSSTTQNAPGTAATAAPSPR